MAFRIEQEAWENGLGNSPIRVELKYYPNNPAGTRWRPDVFGAPGVQVYGRMEWGTGYLNDGSLSPVSGHAGNFTTITLDYRGACLACSFNQTGFSTHSPGDGHYHTIHLKVTSGGISYFDFFEYYDLDLPGTRYTYGVRPMVAPASGIEPTTSGRYSIAQKVLAGGTGQVARGLHLSGSGIPTPADVTVADRAGAVRRDGITALTLVVPSEQETSSGQDLSTLKLKVADALSATRSAGPRVVTVRIYDSRGRLVRNAVNESLAAGTYTYAWDSRSDDGRAVRPGVYTAIMTAGEFRARAKLIVVRPME